MRLWVKISIISTSILMLVVSICCTILVNTTRNHVIQMTIEQTKSEHNNLSMSFSEMTKYYLRDIDNLVAKQSLIMYCFAHFANEMSVLTLGDKVIYSHISVMPEKILETNNVTGQQIYLGDVNDREVLIVGSSVNIQREDYSVFIVKDVSQLYNSINTMVWKFILISSIGIILGTIFIVILLRYTTMPLRKLRDATRLVAVGKYCDTVNICTKDEVGELAEDFNAMANAIASHITSLKETADNQKLFINGVTHEFKTPITSMLIHTETLLTADLNNDAAKNSLAHINSQCRWLDRLISTLLKLIILEQGIITQEESVYRLLNAVWESTSELLKMRETPLLIECNIDTLEFNFDLMKLLLINLIDNASKASEPGKSVIMRAYDSTLEVSDHGVGIPKQIGRAHV